MMNFRKDLKMKEFGNLLNIPNLDNQLALLPEKAQNEILEKFWIVKCYFYGMQSFLNVSSCHYLNPAIC